jgi:predicted nucleotide-binding protein
MTPDDQVFSRSGEAQQARPNVIFELGWFYGRLGRSRVCILSKRGTAIHSDLSGIVRVEFIENIQEAIAGIEGELRRAGLIN